MDESKTIFEKYYKDVFRFLRGLSANEDLAEELTQETFYRAWKSRDTYRGAGNGISGDVRESGKDANGNVRVWLCTIARNLYYTHCKKQKRFVSTEDCQDFEAEEKSFTEMIADRETAREVHKILHDLREPYKEIFTLRIFGELSFGEIGELFGKSEHWACVTYHRAREMIVYETQKRQK